MLERFRHICRICCDDHARNSVVNRRADNVVSIFVVADVLLLFLLFILLFLLILLLLALLLLTPNNDTSGTCRLFLYELDRDAEFSSSTTTAGFDKDALSISAARRRDGCGWGVTATVGLVVEVVVGIGAEEDDDCGWAGHAME
jgi:hypothetical protein